MKKMRVNEMKLHAWINWDGMGYTLVFYRRFSFRFFAILVFFYESIASLFLYVAPAKPAINCIAIAPCPMSQMVL